MLGDASHHDQHAFQIVTGKADYAGDRLPGVKLYGALLLSRIARGTIKSIDATQALNYPGVRAVITHQDCPIWSEAIFFHGQEVAGVVADDPHIAARATRLIKVEYQSFPFILDPDEAMKDDAVLSGILPGTNYRQITALSRGDVESGMAQAEVVLETSQPWSSSYQHNTLEPHQSVAWWIGQDLYFWAPSQHIHSIRNSVASTINLPLNRVHGSPTLPVRSRR